jgi:hypothetical protein
VTDAATALVAIAAGLTAAGVILRYLRRAWASIMRVHHTVERVAAEFQPNGGSSLRDAIDRIERRVDNVEAFCDEIRQRDTP